MSAPSPWIAVLACLLVATYFGDQAVNDRGWVRAFDVFCVLGWLWWAIRFGAEALVS